MAANETARQTADSQHRNYRVVIFSEVFNTGRTDDEQSTTATNNTTVSRKRFKAIILGLGFSCIVICFIFATLGYTTKFRTCSAQGKCEKDIEKFSKAQNYRLAAALLFIIGMCLIVCFVWLVKNDGHGAELIERPDVVVSDVTAEGLLKTPAPALIHPISQVHNLVYDVPLLEKLAKNDLPHYETVVKVHNEGKSSVTPDGKIITINGIETESVCIQVDEDDINPPPSYLKALDLINEVQEERHSEEDGSG